LRVLAETGVESASYRTVKRRLPIIAKPAVRQAMSAACASHAGLGPASVLYDDKCLVQARPVYHHKRDSIEAHLTIVFAALAVSHWIEHQTGWRIKKFVRTARRYRTVQIRAGRQTLTVADPLPDDPRSALTAIHSPDHVH
jgi:hypothetical protein